MKKLFIVFFLSVSTSIFSQGNFTTEWTSPAGWDGGKLFLLNASSNVYHILLRENSNPLNTRFYNGATHNADYSWTWSGSNFPYIDGIDGIDYGSRIFNDKFDATGDGVNEVIANDVLDGYKIINPTNGQLLFSVTGLINGICDVDNDGYLELVISYFDTISSGVKIISTPAQTVSVSNQNEIVKNYELKQNYPNPFNPTTTIEYSLNKNSDVKIIIYDILGKEVNTLVNQKQVSGTYKLNLNASSLSSGTYFYSLIVDGLVDSKKMILIK